MKRLLSHIIFQRFSTSPFQTHPLSVMSASKLKIGTHNGTFHCDEVLACYMLKILPSYKEAEIIRTRDPEALSTCHAVVDVGGVFDHEQKRYDHHQREFKESCYSLSQGKKPWVTKLSSAGLIYFHYGREILLQIVKALSTDGAVAIDDHILEKVFDKVYENFIEEIDAVDNGISPSDEKPKYKVTTTLSNRVSHFNPRWNEEETDEGQYKRFHEAMQLVGTEFTNVVKDYFTSWIPARRVVEDAILNRCSVDKSGRIIELPFGGVPWKDHLMNIEEEQNIIGQLTYVIYPDNNNNWRVQSVPVRPDSFESRLPLQAEWRGLRNENLSAKAGIQNCVFVHSSGFIGGNETRDGVIKMALKTIACADKQ